MIKVIIVIVLIYLIYTHLTLNVMTNSDIANSLLNLPMKIKISDLTGIGSPSNSNSPLIIRVGLS